MTVDINDLVVGPLTPASGVSVISLDFFVRDVSWLEVYKSGSETPLVLGVDYTVTGEGTATGTVVLTVPADGVDAYTIFLIVPLERSSDLQQRGEFKSGPINIELDNLWQALQGIKTTGARALVAGATSDIPPRLTWDVATAPDKVLMFDATAGAIIEGPTGGDISGANASAIAAADSAAAADASATAAGNSADAAAASAASIVPNNFLLKDDNLLGLASVPIARNNLGLGTAATNSSGDFLSATGGANLGGILNSNGHQIRASNGPDVASASTVALPDTGNGFAITGGATINTITGGAIGTELTLYFEDACTLTNSANLPLPGAANIVTAAGDTLTLNKKTATAWRTQYHRADGTALASLGGLTNGTAQATTSGTAFDYINIPSGTKMIRVSYDQVSLTGNDDHLVQIGPAGGIETSAYTSSSITSGGQTATSTAGFILRKFTAATSITGHMTLTLEDTAANTWVSSHQIKYSGGATDASGGGRKSLADPLTQLRITRTGTNTFDAGSVNIQYA